MKYAVGLIKRRITIMGGNCQKIIDETLFWEHFHSLNSKIPDVNQEIMPGMKWGDHNKLYTPAYWKVQYLFYNSNSNSNFEIKYKLGSNFIEEVIACLLGGFGLKSELGLLAFDRLKKRGLIKKRIDFYSINNCLKELFVINGKTVHYRFYNQKAKYIVAFLNRNDLNQVPLNNDLSLRHWLLSVNGIGPKTASWITRNYLNSKNVAIIDIHIYRAGIITGFFSEKLNIQKDYFKIEKAFIQFCNAIDVNPSKMDALIWLQMKKSNRIALKTIDNIQKQKLCLD